MVPSPALQPPSRPTRVLLGRCAGPRPRPHLAATTLDNTWVPAGSWGDPRRWKPGSTSFVSKVGAELTATQEAGTLQPRWAGDDAWCPP